MSIEEKNLQDIDTHFYPFLGDGRKILRRRNILICATLKTYHLCKYDPLAASCKESCKKIFS